VRLVPGAARWIDLPPLRTGGPRVSRHRRRALILAALSIGLAIAGLVELGRGTASPPTARTVTQVVVLEALSAGDRLSADALGVLRVPARYAGAGAVSDPTAAIGRRLAVALPAGTFLMQPELASTDRLDTGRDVAVRLDDAAGLPAGDIAGAHADVYLVAPGRDSVPTIVLSNVLVVRAGRSGGTAAATLRLPASAVATIIGADGRGSLRLVLRAARGTP
jgi:Flp pilus assembly protein CpaB